MAGLDRSKKRSNSSTSRVSRFSEALGAAQESSQKSGHPTTQPSEQQKTQLSKKSTSQKSKAAQSDEKSGHPVTQQPITAKKTPDELAKRSNPDYTQTTFRIPKKLSRQINRKLMDLADEGIEMDRSDLLKELTEGFIRLANEVGAVEALEQFKNLGTQMDE